MGAPQSWRRHAPQEGNILKLSDTQRVILAAAARRDDGSALPLPKSLRIKGGAVTAVLRSLIQRGLLEETSAIGVSAAWRRTREGRPGALAITDAGLEAIGITPRKAARRPPAKPSAKKAPRLRITRRPVRASSPPRPSKLVVLVNRLKQPAGASLEEIAEATGRQHHSIRGAISGAVKKKLGLNVSSERDSERGRVYRLASKDDAINE